MQIIKINILLILLALCWVWPIFGSDIKDNSCTPLLQNNKIELSVTDGLWAFIEDLLSRQELRISHLERMVLELNENRLENIYSPQEIQTNSTKFIYSKTAAEYFTSAQLDRSQLKHRLGQKIAKLKQNQDERTAVSEQTANPYRKIKFNEVGVPGKFTMGGEQNSQYPTEITYSVAFADTHLTQKQWVDLMKINPSFFKGTEELDGVIQQPDHPVENFTWYAAAWYANVLSKKYGLPETYNFSKFIAQRNTSAAAGNLTPAGGGDVVMLNAPNIYESRGIRLATEAELEWLALAAVNEKSQKNKKYPWGNNLNEVNDYCWYVKNSNQQTHPVAHKKAYDIRGQKFYDLAGNVLSWGNDKIAKLNYSYFESKNPVGEILGSFRVMRNGSYKDDERHLSSAFRDRMWVTEKSDRLGLRLALTCF